MAEQNNVLGLDRFQLTIIKSNYTTIKPFLTKRDKLSQKVSDFKAKMAQKVKEFEESVAAELQSYNEQIAALDNITIAHTKRACGIGLTTEQTMKFLDDSQAFEEYKKSIGLGNDLFQDQTEQRDLDAEEDKEWENRIESGELKEVA